MGIAEAIGRNLDERIQILLGLRGKKADHAVRHGDLEKLVEQILRRREDRASIKEVSVDENANGSFLRFANGTQLCWTQHRKGLAIDVAFQGQYRSAEQIWTFPVPFAKEKVVSVVAQAAAAAASGSYVVGTLPASCRYALTNATTQAAATRIIHLWAVGRWG